MHTLQAHFPPALATVVGSAFTLDAATKNQDWQVIAIHAGITILSGALAAWLKTSRCKPRRKTKPKKSADNAANQQ